MPTQLEYIETTRLLLIEIRNNLNNPDFSLNAFFKGKKARRSLFIDALINTNFLVRLKHGKYKCIYKDEIEPIYVRHLINEHRTLMLNTKNKYRKPKYLNNMENQNNSEWRNNLKPIFDEDLFNWKSKEGGRPSKSDEKLDTIKQLILDNYPELIISKIPITTHDQINKLVYSAIENYFENNLPRLLSKLNNK